jgi:hypothetical protein
VAPDARRPPWSARGRGCAVGLRSERARAARELLGDSGLGLARVLALHGIRAVSTRQCPRRLKGVERRTKRVLNGSGLESDATSGLQPLHGTIPRASAIPRSWRASSAEASPFAIHANRVKLSESAACRRMACVRTLETRAVAARFF